MITAYFIGFLVSLVCAVSYAKVQHLGRQSTADFTVDVLCLVFFVAVWPLTMITCLLYWVLSEIKWWFA